jgi:hypothetical protein
MERTDIHVVIDRVPIGKVALLLPFIYFVFLILYFVFLSVKARQDTTKHSQDKTRQEKRRQGLI